MHNKSVKPKVVWKNYDKTSKKTNQEKTTINIKNEKANITINSLDIEKLDDRYYEPVYANKFKSQIKRTNNFRSNMRKKTLYLLKKFNQ